MAMESQGTLIRRASTILITSSAATDMVIESTRIRCAGVIDFTTGVGGLNFTTSMLIQCNAQDTHCYAVKSVVATAINIYGAFQTTGATSLIVTGYEMQNIAEITDFNGPGGAAAIIDITNLQSTAKEKLIGLRDEGQLSLTLNYNATDAGQAGLRADRAERTKNLYDILFTDVAKSASAMPSRADFFAYCQQFSEQGAVNNKISANAVLEITGAVNYSTKVDE
jgi:hypothetical protein